MVVVDYSSVKERREKKEKEKRRKKRMEAYSCLKLEA